MKKRDFVKAAVGAVVTIGRPTVFGPPLLVVTPARAKRIVKAASSSNGSSVELAKVESASTPGVTYEIKKGADGNVYCSCPAWRFQRKPVADRTCKHIKGLTAAIRRVA